jgi:type II secretory pathway pseudopilin PulG
MGQQQLLLIILGVIIVGIAIAVGLQLFQAGSVGANSDAVQNDLMNIAAHADQYRIRPVSMGGGGGAFTGYQLPTRLATTGNGTYDNPPPDAGEFSITITGVSVPYGPESSWVLTYSPNAENDADRYVWVPTGEFETVGGGTP